jgi:hypothetical protein
LFLPDCREADLFNPDPFATALSKSRTPLPSRTGTLTEGRSAATSSVRNDQTPLSESYPSLREPVATAILPTAPSHDRMMGMVGPRGHDHPRPRFDQRRDTRRFAGAGSAVAGRWTGCELRFSGRRSRRPVALPVPYARDGDRIVGYVVGSAHKA